MDYLKWLPLLPLIMAHPKLLQAVQDNMPDAQLFISDMNALLAKHAKLIQAIETEEPEAIALANQLSPIIAQIAAQH